ncbi:villin-3 isoform X1 [Solanum pennellii]|uniref:Villin-3 isoform X1 n=1 Tax=Solanum pennellii TaxID=28526 RepID=A0ABM1GMH4_SOLPN|nr:villin-3 isoform X1 [Solanum pennellii]XP_015073272.1 villin-3 isoform X1 [Solanum pennellii]
MSGSVKTLDPAFQGAGQRVGTEIWRIEDFQPVPLPKSDYGKFYSGDSYIILQTTSGKGGAYLYDIHFWLGKNTSQDEAGTAAIKTVELDVVLGGRAVQYREVQGHETDKFLSYFKPCIIPLEGGVASGFKKPEEEEFETRLYICKGKRVVRMKQVPFSRSSLNHDDVFILDTKDKIYQFNGANSNIQERAKALEVIQFLKEKYHEGTCDVAIVDDGNLQAESDSGSFWVLFGGFAPISKKVITEDDIVPEKTPPKLSSITDGQVSPVNGELSKSSLENNKCYLLDCGAEVFVWIGRVTQLEERKAAIQTAEEYLVSENRPKATRVTRVIQGYETHSFKSNFDSWPSGSAPAPEEGRGKVAALLKQQGAGVKGASRSAPVIEEVPPLLEEGGKLEVWRINGSAKTPVSKEDIGKFYSGDCYVVLYNYHSHERRDDYYLCWWIGKDSIEEDQIMAARLASTMCNSLKGRPVLGRVFQGKEPPQFVAIFQPMLVLKGGLSTGYKNYIADKGLNDETYTADSVALIQLSGTSVHNNKAVQVDAVPSSLNSNECFLLQSGSSLFSWHGNQSSYEQQQLAAKVAEFLKPGATVKHTKEGTESSAFWFALGGKQSYTSKKVAPEVSRDPHLFAYSFNKGKFEVEEIYNFAQDDLLTEDVLLLDTHAEVFVWVGQSADSKEKQSAFEIGQKYVEMAASLEGLSPNVPLYKITEGNEPCFFTTFFSWDPAKATAHGNSFQKKVMLLFGVGHASENQQRSNGAGGPTQRASALAALNSAFSSPSPPKSGSAPRPAGASQASSQRAAAIAALSNVLTAEKKQSSESGSPVQSNRSSPVRSSRSSPVRSVDSGPAAESDLSTAEVQDSEKVSEPKEIVEPAETNGSEPEQDEGGNESGQAIFSYEQLKAKSDNPVTGIDFKRREAYLSDEEFMSVLGMKKEAFYKLPKWKQDMHKRKTDLF